MKYELETIPIWDSYAADTECPLCWLKERAEKTYHDFFLGNSVMVPEMRVKVNAAGYCPNHFTSLLQSRDNRHGLGLMTHTHFVEQKEWFQNISKKLTGAKKKSTDDMAKIAFRIREKVDTCMICDRINYTLKRYAFTIVYLWKKDAEFKTKVEQSKGFCFPHLADILEMSKEGLPGKLSAEFSAKILEICSENFERLDKEVFWYTQKFDFQNNDKPWGTSKDALHRTIQKLSGKEQLDK